MFDAIEEIFRKIRDSNEHTRALVTLTTAIGAIVIVYFILKLLCQLVQAARLYVFSQFSCCQPDFRKKYGQWAVVSGATDGIGQAMAKNLAGRGMSLIVIGRNEQKLAKTKEMLENIANVGQVVTVKIDLSDSSVSNFESIRDQIDPDNRDIGLLINNAGTFPIEVKRFHKFDIDEILNLVNLNISATLHLTRMIIPGMIKRGRGTVVNVSSIFGSSLGPLIAVYAPTKTFIDRFSEQLQIEYSGYPINIINMKPGGVQTRLFRGLMGPRTVPTLSFAPAPDDYATSSLNALATDIPVFTGTWGHGIILWFSNLTNSLGLHNWIIWIAVKIKGEPETPSTTEAQAVTAQGEPQ